MYGAVYQRTLPAAARTERHNALCDRVQRREACAACARRTPQGGDVSRPPRRSQARVAPHCDGAHRRPGLPVYSAFAVRARPCARCAGTNPGLRGTATRPRRRRRRRSVAPRCNSPGGCWAVSLDIAIRGYAVHKPRGHLSRVPGRAVAACTASACRTPCWRPAHARLQRLQRAAVLTELEFDTCRTL